MSNAQHDGATSGRDVSQSSPQESSPGGSNTGTPDTLITSFSPETFAQRAEHLDTQMSLFKPKSTNFVATGLTSMDRDPFVTTNFVKSEQKLSPTASSFHPFEMKLQGITAAPVRLDQKSENSSAKTEDSNISATQLGTFSIDTSVTRAIKITGIYGPISFAEVENCLREADIFTGGYRIFRHGVNGLIRFSSVVDAQQAYNIATTKHPKWSVDYMTPKEFVKLVEHKDALVSAHEGSVILMAHYPSTIARSKLEDICLDLLSVDGTIYAYQKQLASGTGVFKLIAEFTHIDSANQAVDRLNGKTIHGIVFSVELHKPDIMAVVEVKKSSQRGAPTTPTRNSTGVELSKTFGLMHLPMEDSSNCIQLHADAIVSPTGRSIIGVRSHGSHSSFSDPQLSRRTGLLHTSPGHCAYTPPATLVNSPYGSDSTHMTYHQQLNAPNFNIGTPSRDPRCTTSMPSVYSASGRRQNAMRVATPSPWNGTDPNHNAVKIERIQEGTDVRTTIMLRNIPNKIDLKMLKGIVDGTSFGLYDFMYLRIDFANNCNVGYAFINFEDPYNIIQFVSNIAGKRWKLFNSDKVAEVSYATIQGKDCLVQKFRNSSVMLEAEHYRPKIFYTLGHPLAGMEEKFPPPDNASKMRRSVENAEHVGLFAPRAGQQHRDEQRRSRSLYDRGTRLATLEEADHAATQNYGPYVMTPATSHHFGNTSFTSGCSDHRGRQYGGFAYGHHIQY